MLRSRSVSFVAIAFCPVPQRARKYQAKENLVCPLAIEQACGSREPPGGHAGSALGLTSTCLDVVPNVIDSLTCRHAVLARERPRLWERGIGAGVGSTKYALSSIEGQIVRSMGPAGFDHARSTVWVNRCTSSTHTTP
jgi:hypothetical protein